jgi:hypothetical protein
MPALSLEWNVDESVHNAVLWYETEHDGQGREAGKTITKMHIIHARTEPEMDTYFYRGASLLDFLKKNCDSATARAVLYSQKGFEARMRVKKEVDAKIESRSLWLCCCTCGLILCRFCCCCPGRNWEKDVDKLNDDYYCSRLKEEHPDVTREDVVYQFSSPLITPAAKE